MYETIRFLHRCLSSIPIIVIKNFVKAPHWPIKMSGHTQQVIRHLPEENKLKKTRNLDQQPYYRCAGHNLHSFFKFNHTHCWFNRNTYSINCVEPEMHAKYSISVCKVFDGNASLGSIKCYKIHAL